VKRSLVAAALLLALAGCGDTAPATDSEDYTGPPQVVASRRVDPAVMGTRDKTKTERTCTSRKKNGTCSSWSTKRVKTGTETYVADDEDHVLVLADGTEVDVTPEEYERYPEGATYP
jgi:hypothetical protein